MAQPHAVRPKLRVEPLWARVERNRIKLATFVVLFVVGSAVLLALALVGVPGVLIGGAGVYLGYWTSDPYSYRLLLVLGLAIVGLLALGGFGAAVQLSNAEDWVRNRFKGRELEPDEAATLGPVVSDMAIAAGLPEPPRLTLLDVGTVNAFVVGRTRSRPLIGVTHGFVDDLTAEEQRAAVATLLARVNAGDVMFGTALAALMGPLKAVRESRKAMGKGLHAVTDGCGDSGCGDGCGDGCDSSCSGGGGCGQLVLGALFVALVVALTYAAVLSAAWIVTLWGRALSRTSYEKADAEGMLLVKDPTPMLSALRKSIMSDTSLAQGDLSYDGIFYASTSGTRRVEKIERRRYERLREVLGTEGVAAPPLGPQ